MTETRAAGGDEPAAGDVPGPADGRTVDRIRGFVRGHGAGTIAVINHVGRMGARIVLIAADGSFGDVLAPSVAAARRACDEAPVTVREWDRETTGLISPTPADRVTMGTRRH